jgi:hypothetical protein
MTEIGQLSPIDPSIEHPLGPTVNVPGQPGAMRIVPVSVEDAINYLALARSEAKLQSEESLTRVFERLATDVRPLALGSVHRVREQIRFLATTLLSYHMADKNKVDNIVNILTKERFSHDYLISRKEAKDILGLNVLDMEPELKQAVVELFDCYREMLCLDMPYMPEVFLAGAEQATGDFRRAVIESRELTHVFRTRKEVKRVQMTQPGVPVPIVGYQERIFDESWVEDREI